MATVVGDLVHDDGEHCRTVKVVGSDLSERVSEV
jgi:hypothetical protein